MPNLHDADLHEAYLDAVFARIDRMRRIDASVLTQRYGIDPEALSPVEGQAKPSWIVGRFLVDADAQREELREHLDGLTREFVTDGINFDTAALKAQSLLGNSETLAKQIVKSTAQTALAMDRRWFPWLRSITASQFLLPFVLCNIALYFGWPLLPALTVSAVITTVIAFTQGYSVGMSVTPDLWLMFSEIRDDLEKMLKLPVGPMSLRQRANRLSVRYVATTLKPLVSLTNSTFTGRFGWRSVVLQLAILSVILHFNTLTGMRVYFLSTMIYSIAREAGCCVGTRLRLAQSVRRAS